MQQYPTEGAHLTLTTVRNLAPGHEISTAEDTIPATDAQQPPFNVFEAAHASFTGKDKHQAVRSVLGRGPLISVPTARTPCQFIRHALWGPGALGARVVWLVTGGWRVNPNLTPRDTTSAQSDAYTIRADDSAWHRSLSVQLAVPLPCFRRHG